MHRLIVEGDDMIDEGQDSQCGGLVHSFGGGALPKWVKAENQDTRYWCNPIF